MEGRGIASDRHYSPYVNWHVPLLEELHLVAKSDVDGSGVRQMPEGRIL